MTSGQAKKSYPWPSHSFLDIIGTNTPLRGEWIIGPAESVWDELFPVQLEKEKDARGQGDLYVVSCDYRGDIHSFRSIPYEDPAKSMSLALHAKRLLQRELAIKEGRREAELHRIETG